MFDHITSPAFTARADASVLDVGKNHLGMKKFSTCNCKY